MKTSISLDTCCKIRCFGVSQKGIEKESQKGSKNDIKIELEALGGSTFVILGDFLRGLIFDEFLIGKKYEKK